MMAYEITLITTMAISILFALSLNFITGFCGQISLGHAAFMGVGAYASAMLVKAGVPILVTLPLAGILAGALGFVVGLASLRVRHDFLAITTMGVVFLFVGIVRQQDFLGGAVGISGIPGSSLGRVGFMAVCLGLALGFAVFSVMVKRSWMGFVYDSIADNEDVSRVLGIDVARYKLIAFVIGTAAAGVAGGLYAQHFRYVGPDSFGFVESISVLAMVIVGGIGSVAGVAVAAAVLSVLPLWIQFVDDYKILVYSALLFFMMRYAPDGLTGILRRSFKRTGGNS
jgi:branched-chain amino acid transport system permease protein